MLLSLETLMSDFNDFNDWPLMTGLDFNDWTLMTLTTLMFSDFNNWKNYSGGTDKPGELL